MADVLSMQDFTRSSTADRVRLVHADACFRKLATTDAKGPDLPAEAGEAEVSAGELLHGDLFEVALLGDEAAPACPAAHPHRSTLLQWRVVRRGNCNARQAFRLTKIRRSIELSWQCHIAGITDSLIAANSNEARTLK